MSLILSRKLYESIKIGDDVVVTVTEISKGRVRLSVSAPQSVAILRQEIADKLERQQEAAVERDFGGKIRVAYAARTHSLHESYDDCCLDVGYTVVNRVLVVQAVFVSSDATCGAEMCYPAAQFAKMNAFSWDSIINRITPAVIGEDFDSVEVAQ